MTGDFGDWLRERLMQVELEQAAAWAEPNAGFNVENEDILGRFFDDVNEISEALDLQELWQRQRDRARPRAEEMTGR